MAIIPGAFSADNAIIITNGNGHGSTNTMIRRFSNVQTNTADTAMTLTQSATDGDSITINVTGLYAMTYTDRRTAAALTEFGISNNSNLLTTSIAAVGNDSFRLISASSSGGAGAYSNCSTTRFLVVGDIVRAHTDGLADDTDTQVCFTIVRVF